MNEELENTFALVRKQFLLIFAEAFAETNDLSYASKCATSFLSAIIGGGNKDDNHRDIFSSFKM